MTDAQGRLSRIGHTEATELLSARLDAPLTADQQQLLASHLATCERCRAFAGQMDRMTAGLRDLPSLPASPGVSHGVRTALQHRSSLGQRFSGWIAGHPTLGAATAAASALVIVAVIATRVLMPADAPSTVRLAATNSVTQTAGAIAMEASLESSATVPPTPQESAAAKTLPTEGPQFPVVQISVTPTTAPTITPDREPAASQTSTPVPARSAVAVETPEPTPIAVETVIVLPSPTETGEPPLTVAPTQTAQPTATSTETATATPLPTITLTPTATETASPTNTATPSLTPTPTPTATLTPSPTSTLTARPTWTPLPSPVPTETLEPPRTPEPEATEDGAESTGENTQAEPTSAIKPRATDLPTEEPTEAPDDGDPSDTPQPIEETEQPTGEAGGEDSDGGIVPRTPESGDEGDWDEGDSGETDDGAATDDAAAQDDQGDEASAVLDRCEVVAELPEGFGTFTGGLPVHGSGDSLALVAIGPDGRAVVVDAETPGVLYDLGSAQSPFWSPRGRVLVYQDVNSPQPTLRVWDRDQKDAAPFAIGTAAYAEGATDLPLGWVDSQIAYVTVYADQPGYVEVHLSDWDGSNDRIVWSGNEVELAGFQGYATFDGVFIPTSEGWLFADGAGTSTLLPGPNAFVEGVSANLTAGLVAYHGGGGLFIAAIEAPDQVIAAIPFSGEPGSGYALDPDGRGIVVIDGGLLTIYDLYGDVLGSGASASFIAGPAWQVDGIYFLRIGGQTDVCWIRPDALLADG